MSPIAFLQLLFIESHLFLFRKFGDIDDFVSRHLGMQGWLSGRIRARRRFGRFRRVAVGTIRLTHNAVTVVLPPPPVTPPERGASVRHDPSPPFALNHRPLT